MVDSNQPRELQIYQNPNTHKSVTAIQRQSIDL